MVTKEKKLNFILHCCKIMLIHKEDHIWFYKLIFAIIEQGLFNKPDSCMESVDLISNQIV